MKIAILGNGGREHALCHAIKKSPIVREIFCLPGNAGTSLISKNVDIDINDFESVKDFVLKKNIDIVIIGPEKPLVEGITDFLEKNGIKVFGPNKVASQLEGSKIFTKKICKEYKIPTANFDIFENKKDALNYLKKCSFPIVVKADGLASGKGVYICETSNQSVLAIEEIFNGKFGIANQVLIEEFLDGEEMSFFIISDGDNFKKFGTAQDHKRVNEGDTGLNTGGMGAYSPSRLENKILDQKILKKIIEPTLKALEDINENFKGFLYAGLMIVNGEPFLIEYNVRMGDPECQTILPRLKNDFLDVVIACLSKNLKSTDLEFDDKKTLCIVLCSKGYPEKYNNNIEIKNLDNISLKENEYLFHAGTKVENLKIYSNGGRVLNFVIKTNSFEKNRASAIDLIKKLNWGNGFFRKDIGYKVIKQ